MSVSRPVILLGMAVFLPLGENIQGQVSVILASTRTLQVRVTVRMMTTSRVSDREPVSSEKVEDRRMVTVS